jgi:hypothetical protein
MMLPAGRECDMWAAVLRDPVTKVYLIGCCLCLAATACEEWREARVESVLGPLLAEQAKVEKRLAAIEAEERRQWKPGYWYRPGDNTAREIEGAELRMFKQPRLEMEISPLREERQRHRIRAWIWCGIPLVWGGILIVWSAYPLLRKSRTARSDSIQEEPR